MNKQHEQLASPISSNEQQSSLNIWNNNSMITHKENAECQQHGNQQHINNSINLQEHQSQRCPEFTSTPTTYPGYTINIKINNI
jgi:hypothetical protein